MEISAIRNLGWRRHGDASGALATRYAWPAWPGRVLLAVLTIFFLAAAVGNGAVLDATLNRFSAIHAVLGLLMGSGIICAGLAVASGLAGIVLSMVEALPHVALGAALGVLPFAQASDPSPAKSGDAGQSSIARSEMQFGLYMGKSSSPPSDVHLVAPDDTDVTLKDVKWKPESFKPSPYYGGRGIDWNSRFPRFGLMIDYTHAKATAIRGQTVSHTGRHRGADVPPSGPMGEIFDKLEFTHGLNYLTLNGVFRATGLNRRIVPYAALGIGFAVPHVDLRRAGQDKEDIVQEAQITGVAAQVLGGIEWRVFKSDRRSLFTEYKLTHTSNDVTLNSGGSVAADIWVHQFVFGGYFTPWRAGDAAARQ